jgi:hypothetical protein
MRCLGAVAGVVLMFQLLFGNWECRGWSQNWRRVETSQNATAHAQGNEYAQLGKEMCKTRELSFLGKGGDADLTGVLSTTRV